MTEPQELTGKTFLSPGRGRTLKLSPLILLAGCDIAPQGKFERGRFSRYNEPTENV